MNLNFCCDVRIVGKEFGINIYPSVFVPTAQAGGSGLMLYENILLVYILYLDTKENPLSAVY